MVSLRENESFESLMKRFKRQSETANIVQDYKKHLEFVPKSESRKRKKEAAKKKFLRRKRLEQFYSDDIL